jgi:hypothetical protein
VSQAVCSCWSGSRSDACRRSRIGCRRFAIAPAEIVSLPPTVLVFELDFWGKKPEKPEWEGVIRGHVAPELARLVVATGGRVFQSTQESSEAIPDFLAWSALASLEIASQKSGHANYERYVVGAWRYPGDLALLRAELKTDFALTVLVRDIYQSGGSTAASAFGGVHYYFKQVVVACVTDLRHG